MAKVDTQYVYAGIKFSAYEISAEKINKKTNYRYGNHKLLGNPESQQAIGKGVHKITLAGKYYPVLGGNMNALDQLRAKADEMIPYALVTGYGKNLGKYLCLDISDGHTRLMDDGRAQVVTFTITLEKYA